MAPESQSIYTLLVVESPVLARIIQRLAPPSVYVMATGGFCWRPDYDAVKNRLSAVADPKKIDFRKELKEQARWAGNIVVAVDSDPSGDFIAWSLARFMDTLEIKRGKLNHLSKSGIYSLLSETEPLHPDRLETRLKNRFLIHATWGKTRLLPPMQKAGLAALFGGFTPFTAFVDEHNMLYRSQTPISCTIDEWVSVRPDDQRTFYREQKPLSTFDVIDLIVSQNLAPDYTDAQVLLQQLFQTMLPESHESLISYPRTEARAFYSETWDSLRAQYLKNAGTNELKPTFLQEIASPEEPHDSIHPLNLSVTPQSVSGELPGDIGKLYSIIYQHTMDTLTMPVPLQHFYISDLNPDTCFFPLQEESGHIQPESLRPCLTLNEAAHGLSRLGILKPSSFGKDTDQWIRNHWVEMNGRLASPGKGIVPLLNHAQFYHSILTHLNDISDDPSLSSETVTAIISS